MSAQDYSLNINTGYSPRRVSILRPFIRMIGVAFGECYRRQRLQKLLRLSTDQLMDCGLERAEVIEALSAPLSENAAVRLYKHRADRAAAC